MKKLICLFLMVAILSTMLVGCADVNDDTKMKETFLFHFGGNGKNAADVIIEYDGGTYNGARIVMLDYESHEKEEKIVRLTEDAAIKYYDTNTLYAYKYGIFFSLKAALMFGIITDEDAMDIANKYNEAITCYTDVCDKYDFDSCTVNLEAYDKKIADLQPNAIMIKFDKKVVLGGKVDEKEQLIEYINSHFDSAIVTEIGLHIEETAEYKLFKVFINNNELENLPTIMSELASVPGLLEISCYSRRLYPTI